MSAKDIAEKYSATDPDNTFIIPGAIKDYCGNDLSEKISSMLDDFGMVSKAYLDLLEEVEKANKRIIYLEATGESSAGTIKDFFDRNSELEEEVEKLLGESETNRLNIEAFVKLTESWDEHPEGYDGPCYCALCRSYS